MNSLLTTGYGHGSGVTGMTGIALIQHRAGGVLPRHERWPVFPPPAVPERDKCCAMSQEASPDEGPSGFPVSREKPQDASWGDFIHAVEHAYDQYVERSRWRHIAAEPPPPQREAMEAADHE